MATRASTPLQPEHSAPASHTSPAPALARGSQGPSLGSVPMLLDPGRGPWTWMLSAARLGCRRGRIVPLTINAWHAPGISANIAGDGGSGYVGQLVRQGYVPIPHDYLPCVAWGESRAGAPDSVYLDKHIGHDIEGRGCERWTDAWIRPLQLGHVVQWESDAEGRDAFLIAAWTHLCNGGKPPAPVQVRLAVQPVLSRIESEAAYMTEAARILIRQLAENLPVEHYTDTVRDILRRRDLPIPEVATRDQ